MQSSGSTRKTPPVREKTQFMQTTPVPSKKSNFPFGFSDISLAGCLLRIGILLSFIAIMVAIIGACYFVYKYYTIAATLPDVAELKTRASQFETTRILDRNGNTLYEILDPNAGRRTYVPLAKISPYVIATTLATEDEDFYKHPGYNPVAIIRALFQNLGAGETVSGASTITQQLARTLF